MHQQQHFSAHCLAPPLSSSSSHLPAYIPPSSPLQHKTASDTSRITKRTSHIRPQDLNAQPTGPRINRAHASCQPWPWSTFPRHPDTRLSGNSSLLLLKQSSPKHVETTKPRRLLLPSHTPLLPLPDPHTPSSSDLHPKAPAHAPVRCHNRSSFVVLSPLNLQPSRANP